MRRREFIAGLGSAAAWPLVARAQQQALPVVGWLHGQSQESVQERVPAFR
jgi:putative ABC transport system substrate-binding protein